MDTEVRPSCSNLKRVEILAGEVSPLQIHQQAKLSLRCFKVLVIYMMMTSMCMHLGPDVLKARKMESSFIHSFIHSFKIQIVNTSEHNRVAQFTHTLGQFF